MNNATSIFGIPEFQSTTYDASSNGSMAMAKAKIVYPSGVEEEGHFVNGQLHGEGKRTHPDGRIESGTFVDGRWQAPVPERPTVDITALQGTLHLSNGIIIEGLFRLVEEQKAAPTAQEDEDTDTEDCFERGDRVNKRRATTRAATNGSTAAGTSPAPPAAPRRRRPRRKRKTVERYAPTLNGTPGANNEHTAGRPIDPPDFSFDPTGRGDPAAQPRGVSNLSQMHGRRDGGRAPRCSGYKRDDFVVSDDSSDESSDADSSDESSDAESSEESSGAESSEEEEGKEAAAGRRSKRRRLCQRRTTQSK